MAGLVDISIKNFKHILSCNTLQNYLNKECIVTQKSDGIKICIKIQNNQYRVFYKELELKKEWFKGFSKDDYNALDESKGIAQYKRIFDFLDTKQHLINELDDCILFCEFIMNKATLTRTYKRFGDLVLLNVGTEWNNNRDEVHRVAQHLDLKTPFLITKGILKDFIHELDGYLDIQSQFGGKEEGIILYFPELKETFKLLQADQHDKETRRAKKNEYYETKEYYKALKEIITRIQGDINWGTIKELLAYSKYSNIKTKFTQLQQIEDTLENALFYNAIKNAGKALVIGKFRVLTQAHENIIKEAFKDKNIKEVVVCVVSGKDTKHTKELRLEMIERLKEKYNIRVIQHVSANIFSIFNKIGIPALKVFCGSDRFKSYNAMLDNSFSKVIEIKRDDKSLSATKIINNINNRSYFTQNASSLIHDMYSRIKETYN